MSRKKQREEIIKTLYIIDINGDYSKDELDDYTNEIIDGIIKNQDEIDKILIENLENWSLRRLTYLDRAILRFATYELIYTETAMEIVINEALELTKKYSDEGDGKTRGFINKVLDKIKNYLNK